MDLAALKRTHLSQLCDHTRTLYAHPELRRLFFELTQRCNERCYHCGSSCTATAPAELPTAKWHSLIDEVARDFDTSRMMLCVTGGEPLLHPDFFEIMAHARDAGLAWGMTSNATLITPHVARRLARVGMRTISVSIDGLEQTHDRLRRTPGGFRRAMAGIENLLEVGAFSAVQVTTVVNHETISELDDLFRVLDELDIDSWRVIGLEPIGRARAHPELLLTDDDWRLLLGYIRAMRLAGHPLEFGCSHYLGLELEAEVREWYWLCNAGVYTASVTSTGDVCACLDIERRPETVQGSVLEDRLRDIWEGRFELFRRDLSELSATCAGCEHAPFCRGDAHHSFDYDEGRPMLCMRHVLFD